MKLGGTVQERDRHGEALAQANDNQGDEAHPDNQLVHPQSGVVSNVTPELLVGQGDVVHGGVGQPLVDEAVARVDPDLQPNRGKQADEHEYQDQEEDPEDYEVSSACLKCNASISIFISL